MAGDIHSDKAIHRTRWWSANKDHARRTAVQLAAIDRTYGRGVAVAISPWVGRLSNVLPDWGIAARARSGGCWTDELEYQHRLPDHPAAAAVAVVWRENGKSNEQSFKYVTLAQFASSTFCGNPFDNSTLFLCWRLRSAHIRVYILCALCLLSASNSSRDRRQAIKKNAAMVAWLLYAS